jgi:GNAT superfamily N-acetyltransferase
VIAGCTIEAYRRDLDDIEEITRLLHRAYAPLLAAGMNYTAATQSDDVTRARLDAAAIAWLAKCNSRTIGTICYYTTRRSETFPGWFRRDDVGIFAQLAVNPSLQRRGLGAQLVRTAERYASEQGKAELACDTAENATHLRRYYADLGYREVATYQWPDANYRSIILSKTLNGVR